jgi:hypothetical protein
MEKVNNIEKKETETVRINITLRGLYAKWALEIKALGLATSNHDLVNQGIKVLHTNLTEERLKIARLKTLEKAGEG